MSKLYELKVYPIACEDDTISWGAEFYDIKGCVGGGDTPEEAVADAYANLDGYLDYLKETNQEIPEEYNEPVYSGKFTTRISPKLHKQVSELSERFGVSLNSMVAEAIALYIGEKGIKEEDRKVTINYTPTNNNLFVLGGNGYENTRYY